VYADLGHGRKPWLVISNNQRNRSRKGDLVAVRVTTTLRSTTLPTVVELTAADRPLVGAALCDDPYVIGNDEITDAGGAVSPSTLRAVEDALRTAFGL
jgi:mRNA interferase MazF